MALTFVTIGPLNPSKTIWSSFLIFPSTKRQSIVVPYPSIILTSITVHANLSFLTLILFEILGIVVAYLTSKDKISGTPSPVIPEVGTNGM